MSEPNESMQRLRRIPVPRIVGADDRRRRLVVKGGPRDSWRDLYYLLLTKTWLAFMGIVAAVYLGTNLVFALAYWPDTAGLANGRPHSFADAFNFSVETLGTIGYGVLAPRDLYTNALVTLEAFTSISLTAVLTGLIFARVSRPTARVLFSNIALITDFEGQRTLMLRAANQRTNQILQAQATMSLAHQVLTPEGVGIRRLDELPMRRARSPLFALTWTLMHTIDETSPLHGIDDAALRDMQAEFVVMLSGVDETLAQQVHARRSYIADEIRWDRHFEDVLTPLDEDGSRWMIDYTRFHDLRPLPEPRPQA